MSNRKIYSADVADNSRRSGGIGYLGVVAGAAVIFANVPASAIETVGQNIQKQNLYTKAIHGDAWASKLTDNSSTGYKGLETDTDLKLAQVVSRINTLDSSQGVEKKIFLNETIEDFISSTNKLLDSDVHRESLLYGLEFALKLPSGCAIPSYDLHPDKEFSLVWQAKNGDILSTAFSTDGLIRYAYFSPETKDSAKGKVAFERVSFLGKKNDEPTAEALKLFIQKFSKA